MRLTAQTKGGFYAAHPKAIEHVAQFLRPPDRGRFTIIDPCAGEGDAIAQLAGILKCHASGVYAIEIDHGRAEAVHANLPRANVLAPASFFGTRISFGSFSFAWVNPPFDHNVDGGRMETEFLTRATQLLKPGGVMALICPQSVADLYTTRAIFSQWYDAVRVVPFPEKYRPYREVAVLGTRSERYHDHHYGRWESTLLPNAPDHFDIPPTFGTPRFRQTQLLPSEAIRMLWGSPLRRRLETVEEPPLGSPPLALSKGHIALLLSAGHLDGVVRPPNEPPHVVRGTARKVEYKSAEEEREDDDGNITVVTTISQKIVLTVRTLDTAGNITTFSDNPATEIKIDGEDQASESDAEESETDDVEIVDAEIDLEGEGELDEADESPARDEREIARRLATERDYVIPLATD